MHLMFVCVILTPNTDTERDNFVCTSTREAILIFAVSHVGVQSRQVSCVYDIVDQKQVGKKWKKKNLSETLYSR